MTTTSQWWYAATTAITATRFMPVMGNAVANAAEAGPRCQVDQAGTLHQMQITLSAAPGGATSWRFQVSVNGVLSTVLDVTISGASTTGTVVGDVALSAYDLVSIKATATGSPASSTVTAWTEFDPTTANAYCYPSSGSTLITGTGFAGRLFGGGTITSAGPGGGNTAVVSAVAGQITSWSMFISAAPGVGHSNTYSILVNGIEDATSIITISGAAVSGNLTGLTIAVATGDYLEMKVKSSFNSPNLRWCATLTPTTANQWLIYSNWTSSPSQSAVNYISGGVIGVDSWTATEATVQLALPANLTAVGIAAAINSAPGAARSWTFRNRINAGNGGLSFAISGGSAKSGSGGGADNYLSTDLLDISVTPAGTPGAATGLSVGFAMTNTITSAMRQRLTKGVGL